MYDILQGEKEFLMLDYIYESMYIFNCLLLQVVGKAFMNAVKQEIRMSEEAAKRHASNKGTAHAAETVRYTCTAG